MVAGASKGGRCLPRNASWAVASFLFGVMLTAAFFLLMHASGRGRGVIGRLQPPLLPAQAGGSGGALGRHASPPPPPPLPLYSKWLHPPPLPWEPLLTQDQLRRGLSFYGSGRRMERVAAQLMAGRPLTAVTIGGSVTRGGGASSKAAQFPAMFFHFLNSTFPHREHLFLNKGIGATNSGIFSACAEKLVPQATGLVVVEFTLNEPADLPYTQPHRRGFEQLLRKLLRLPGAPAVIVLHHYGWWHSTGDGLNAGLFYRQAEEQLGTMSQFYDLPSPSVRNAIFDLMRANIAPYKASAVAVHGLKNDLGIDIPGAPAGSESEFYYHDSIHPGDLGHQLMAELLAGVVLTAVKNVAQAAAGGGGGAATVAAGATEGAAAATGGKSQPVELPPPMIPGNADVPTSLCAMQEDFKSVAKRMKGFEYKAERPRAKAFVDQKWGYTGSEPGAWIELEVSTEESPGSSGGGATAYLGHLKSYQGMGLAFVECKSGCKCSPSHVDGLWQDRVSLMQMHAVAVTQHPKCRLRVTIARRSSSSPGGEDPPGNGFKFQLSAIMVAQSPAVVHSYAAQAADLAAAAGR